MATPQHLIKVAIFVRDLLQVDEQMIKFGRDNWYQESTTPDVIVIDELSALPIGRTEDYDGDTESMRYGERTRRTVTINFYGDTAYQHVQSLKLLQASQASYELQRDLGIAIMQHTNVADLRQTIGTEFSSRYEMTLVMRETEAANVATLRIDEPQFTVIDEQGET
jgi:hypothetical protein